MGTVRVQPWSREVWELARKQHGVVAHRQLKEAGMGAEEIRHRTRNGRLHRLMRGVYAVGRPQVGTRGRWMAGVLACGPHALLSHRSAAGLWRIRPERSEPIEIVLPLHLRTRHPQIRAHRRHEHEAPGRRVIDGIPVTDPIATLVDLASCLPTGQLEAAINEADHLDLVDPERLLFAIDSLPRRSGVGRLRALLEAPTVSLASTELERRFLLLARQAGLPAPQTQTHLNSYRVDFHWPDLGLVVEADSLRYHRTAFKQASDKRRDNAHVASGLTALRFTHRDVKYNPNYVRTMLARTARRLAATKVGPLTGR
jgi:very-short-patch-repair endonuclease/predicted transcriptional regulator of viral defense system